MNRGIHVQAPTTSYSLAFKHLRGTITLSPGGDQVYVSGGRDLNQWEVIQLLMESPPLEQLPTGMLRGHTLATAVYVGGCEWFSSPYETGVALVPGPHHKVTKHQLRRAALTEAVAELPAVDRAYFHLVLSELEGRDIAPILHKVLHRKCTDWVQLIHHVVGSENPLLNRYEGTPNAFQ